MYQLNGDDGQYYFFNTYPIPVSDVLKVAISDDCFIVNSVAAQRTFVFKFDGIDFVFLQEINDAEEQIHDPTISGDGKYFSYKKGPSNAVIYEYYGTNYRRAQEIEAN